MRNLLAIIIAVFGTVITNAQRQVTSSTLPTLAEVYASRAAPGANTDITSIRLNQTGLVVKGASSNALTFKVNETLSNERILSFLVNDANRTIDLSGDLNVPSKTGNALKYFRVNAGETAFELVTLSGGGDLLAANNLSDLANTATARTNLGLAIGTNVQAYDPDLFTYAGITPSANVQTLLGAADYAAFKTSLSLENVTNESKATMFTSPTFTGTPVVPGYMQSTATVGVSTCPTSSSTQTITHGLGRTPTVIEIYGVGRFTSNAAATPTPFSSGTWTSTSGNSCVYMTSAGTTTQDGLSSTTFSVFIATSSGNNISGVIQNVGATTFDIVWTETGTAVALPFRWKAQ
jgi:hypothetical protein